MRFNPCRGYSRGQSRRAILVVIVVAFFVIIAGTSAYLLKSDKSDQAANQSTEIIESENRPEVSETKEENETITPLVEENEESSEIVEAPVESEVVETKDTAPKPEKAVKDRFAGQVIDEETKEPISGAKILLLGSKEGFLTANQDTMEEIMETETDAEGRFNLDVVSNKYHNEDIYTTIIHVSEESYASRSVLFLGIPGIKEKLEDSKEKIVVELGDSGSVSGQVVDQNQDPVPYALVGSYLMAEDINSSFQGNSNSYATLFGSITTADSNGYFTLNNLPADAENYRIPGDAKGYAGGVSDKLNTGAQHAVIELNSNVSNVEGMVTFADGRGVDGAWIVLSLKDNNNIEDMRMSFKLKQTNSDGRYRIEDVMEGNYQVMVSENALSSTGAGGKMINEENFVVPTGETVTKNWQFPEDIIVKGKFVDALTGEPVPDVEVSGSSFYTYNQDTQSFDKEVDKEPGKVVRTNSRGEFEIDVFETYSTPKVYYRVKDTYFMAKASDDYAPTPDGSYSITDVEKAKAEGVVIELEAGMNVTGVVLDKDGEEPVPNVNISYTYAQSNRSVTHRRKTNVDGEFNFIIRENENIDILAKSDQGWGMYHGLITPENADEKIVITLAANNAVAGRVLKDDEPQTGINVVVQKSHTTIGYTNVYETAVTDGDGAYYIDGLPEGTYKASVQTHSHPELSAGIKPVEFTVESGDVAEGIDLIVDESEFFDGYVKDEDGNPIENANVRHWIYNRQMYGNNNIKTDKDGYFKIIGVGEDDVINQILISADGYVGENKNNLSLYDSPLEVVLKKLREVTIKVVKSDGKTPVRKYQYLRYSNAWDAGGSADSTPVTINDPNGEALIEGIRNSAVRIEVAELDQNDEPTGNKVSARISPNAADNGEPFLIKLGDLYSISGRVIDDESEDPVEGATVKIVSENNYGNGASIPEDSVFTLPTAETDKRGEFELNGLTEGQYTLTAEKEGLSAKERITREVGPNADAVNEEEELVLRLAGLAKITGYVKDHNGNTPKSASIYYNDQVTWQHQSLSVEADGTYEIPDLSAGRYSVSMSMPGSYFHLSEQVELAGGETKTVNFDLSNTIAVNFTVTGSGDVQIGSNSAFAQMTPTNPVEDPTNAGSGGYTIRANEGYISYTYPGENRVNLSSTSGNQGGGYVAVTDIAPTPKEQDRTFSASVTKALAVIEYLDEETPNYEGNISFIQEFNGEELNAFNSWGSSSSRNIPMIVSGRWKATFRSNDGQYTGDSDWINVQPGADNIFVIFPEKQVNEQAKVRFIQQALLNLGFDPGPIDGLFGPMTSAAIRKFQENYDLPATGQASEEVYEILQDIENGTFESDAPSE